MKGRGYSVCGALGLVTWYSSGMSSPHTSYPQSDIGSNPLIMGMNSTLLDSDGKQSFLFPGVAPVQTCKRCLTMF